MAGSKKEGEGLDLIARNAKATQRYEIEERVEAGLVLTGSEVKSLRMRRADLEGSFARIERNEMFIYAMHIAPYEQATVWGHEPKRTRKLLLHRGEIEKWFGRVTMRGYAIVPMRLYFRNGHAKVELGLGKGRRIGDERHELRKEADMKEARAEIARTKGRR